MVILEPKENMYYKDKNTGIVYPGVLYLGIYDSEDNYVLVDEAEFQQYIENN